MIIDQDAPLEINYYSHTFIHGNRQMVRIILESNVDLFHRDDIGQSPIHYLAGNGNDNVINELCGRKFDVDILNDNGETPLYCAASAGLPNTVEFLLNNGAKPNAQNFACRSPLLAAFSSAKYMSAKDGTRYQDVIELLLKYGADPQIQPPGLSDIFETALEYHLIILLESVIAHLALMAKRGNTISEHNALLIDSHAIAANFFKICQNQLTTLETIKIDDYLNLYQLLISSDRQIEQYARNSNIVSKVRSICNNKDSHLPYGFKIRKRFEQAAEMVKLKKKASFAFCDLTQLSYNAHFLFVDKIIEYLSRMDLQHLCEV